MAKQETKGEGLKKSKGGKKGKGGDKPSGESQGKKGGSNRNNEVMLSHN